MKTLEIQLILIGIDRPLHRIHVHIQAIVEQYLICRNNRCLDKNVVLFHLNCHKMAQKLRPLVQRTTFEPDPNRKIVESHNEENEEHDSVWSGWLGWPS